MTARECMARAWHDGSDHAATVPFGGPLCDCEQVAGRIMPMLAEAWDEGYGDCLIYHQSHGLSGSETNPYETKEGRHVDQ
ncbi:hypothetical protein K3888_11270 [Dietzia aurantiaca]|uniref:hypothetical protein n=1 Tax=Dietzia aurantiaca TaxID=983873 RepID=UPI001E53218D|nr:hypothetical protein [Dietzia aurantiaca]MCD2263278.1 hypothetical protein [Dietzia aurantiaca]